MTPDQPAANLGLATTRELLDEIRSRIDVDYISGMPGGLDYTTVGGRPEQRGVALPVAPDHTFTISDADDGHPVISAQRDEDDDWGPVCSCEYSGPATCGVHGDGVDVISGKPSASFDDFTEAQREDGAVQGHEYVPDLSYDNREICGFGWPKPPCNQQRDHPIHQREPVQGHEPTEGADDD